MTTNSPALRAVVAAALLLAAPAFADTAPRPGSVDPRIRTVAFRANDVVAIDGRYGFLTMIEFAPDERIDNVAIGDSLAWQVVPSRSAHMLFLKPMEANAATNLAVVTDRRTYAFALSARAPSRGRTGAPTRDGVYRVIFRYPEDEVRAAELAAARARTEAMARDRAAAAIRAAETTPAHWNMGYRTSGAAALKPKVVLDDGRFTYFQFPAHAESPALFAIEADGEETLVNYVVRGPYTIVERLAPAWRLRAGRSSARVVNTRWRADPAPSVVATPQRIVVRDAPSVVAPVVASAASSRRPVRTHAVRKGPTP